MEKEEFIKLKKAYTASIRGNIEDRYRVGELVELPDEGDLVIMGDLHGNRTNFRRVLRAADLANHPKRHMVLQEATHTWEVKEDRSYLLHEDMVYLKSRFPDRVHVILGNHELAELTGQEILKGGICYNILFNEGMKRHYGAYYPEIRELFEDYIRTMPLACRAAKSKIFMCHSTPPRKFIPHFRLQFFRKGTGNPERDKTLAEKLVWGRDLSQESADLFAKMVESEIIIVGHTACKEGYRIPNTRHIIIDSKGLYATSLHFNLARAYTQAALVKNIQYINKKEIREYERKVKQQQNQNSQEAI